MPPQQQPASQYGASPVPQEAPVQQYAAPVPQQEAPVQQYAAPVPQQEAPVQQYAAPVPQQQAPVQQYAAPVPQQQAPVQQYSAPAPQQQAPVQQYSAPAPQQQAPAYGGYGQSAPQMGFAPQLPQLPNTCAIGFSEPIHEGQEVTETYCRCPSGTYGITCQENFANPCSVEGRQYNPADASFGPHYFIECNWNTPYLFKCPANLVWNQQIETCDWPYTPSYGSYAPAPAPYAPAPAQYAPAPAQYAPVPAAQPSYRSNY